MRLYSKTEVKFVLGNFIHALYERRKVRENLLSKISHLGVSNHIARRDYVFAKI